MRLLVVEDEPQLRSHLVSALKGQRYAIDEAGDGLEADLLADINTYDAVILDLGLPGLDGLSLLRQWRLRGMESPVLVLTARSRWPEKVEGMDAGADDYLAKPFHIEELLARVRALLRRAVRRGTPDLACGALVLHTRTGRVTRGGAPVDLTALEFRVISYLMHHSDRIVGRSELLEHIYDEESERDSNTIEVFIARLRRKLGPEVIETVRGRGYRIGAPTG